MSSIVLFSGGLDSAVLLADEASRGDVHPVYVSAGLAWEKPERAVAEALVGWLGRRGAIPRLAALGVDMSDIYAATHWAVQGRPPAYDTPDEDVYLPGRNIILLSKAAVYAAAIGASRIAIGTLAHNPFPDATPEFRDAIGRAVSLGLGHPLAIDAPYATLEKAAVIRRGLALGVPFELTLSCMNPGVGGRDSRSEDRSAAPGAHESRTRKPESHPVHCGACSKCRERHDAFQAAGVADPTLYLIPPPR